MPRKKSIRRFEPRYGVSQEIVDAEAVHVAREHADRLLASTDELNASLQKIRSAWRETDEVAESLIRLHAAREALAYRCLIARDLYHILALYVTAMRAALPETSGTPAPKCGTVTAPPGDREPEPFAPFSESLFGER